MKPALQIFVWLLLGCGPSSQQTDALDSARQMPAQHRRSSSDTGCDSPWEYSFEECCSTFFAGQLGATLMSCSPWTGGEYYRDSPCAYAVACEDAFFECSPAGADLALLFRGECR